MPATVGNVATSGKIICNLHYYINFNTICGKCKNIAYRHQRTCINSGYIACAAINYFRANHASLYLHIIRSRQFKSCNRVWRLVCFNTSCICRLIPLRRNTKMLRINVQEVLCLCCLCDRQYCQELVSLKPSKSVAIDASLLSRDQLHNVGLLFMSFSRKSSASSSSISLSPLCQTLPQLSSIQTSDIAEVS